MNEAKIDKGRARPVLKESGKHSIRTLVTAHLWRRRLGHGTAVGKEENLDGQRQPCVQRYDDDEQHLGRLDVCRAQDGPPVCTSDKRSTA